MLWVSTRRNSSVEGQWSDLMAFLSLESDIDDLKAQP